MILVCFPIYKQNGTQPNRGAAMVQGQDVGGGAGTPQGDQGGPDEERRKR